MDLELAFPPQGHNAAATGRCRPRSARVRRPHGVLRGLGRSLTADTATLTAIGNDSDFALVFSEQLRLLGAKGDIALGISTSGQSANVTRGRTAAGERRARSGNVSRDRLHGALRDHRP